MGNRRSGRSGRVILALWLALMVIVALAQRCKAQWGEPTLTPLEAQATLDAARVDATAAVRFATANAPTRTPVPTPIPTNTPMPTMTETNTPAPTETMQPSATNTVQVTAAIRATETLAPKVKQQADGFDIGRYVPYAIALGIALAAMGWHALKNAIAKL
jgi:cytoskeletal protein RodZ